MSEFLILGAESSGKTTLVHRLLEYIHEKNQKMTADPAIMSTIPTVGVEINNLTINNVDYNCREVSASMASKWETFVPYSIGVIFLIDSCDLGSAAASITLLHELLSITVTQKIAIIFNKTDLCDIVNVIILKNLIRLDELKKSNKNITGVFAGSLLSFELAMQFSNWMSNSCNSTVIN